MKIPIYRNWNLLRVLRLVVGATGTVQGILINEYALSLFSFLLVYMAIASAGDSLANDSEVELKAAELPTSEFQHQMQHEELDPYQ